MSVSVQPDNFVDELCIADLRTRVAVDLAPLISTVVEDADSRLVIVADVVDCWLRLPADVRALYDTPKTYAGLPRFVGDYVDGIDCAWVRRHDGDPDEVDYADAEQRCYLDWREHEAEVRRRRTAGEPPSEEWLLLITADQRGGCTGSR